MARRRGRGEYGATCNVFLDHETESDPMDPNMVITTFTATVEYSECVIVGDVVIADDHGVLDNIAMNLSSDNGSTQIWNYPYLGTELAAGTVVTATATYMLPQTPVPKTGSDTI